MRADPQGGALKRSVSVTQKQLEFIEASADEVLFGGAAGGGKSVGQVLDAAVFAISYPKSRQIIFRKTLRELEMTIIRTALAMLPREIYTYSASKYSGRFSNGSTLDFGYCDGDADVFRYQSAEYDVVRFDELTHFGEFAYLYMFSRVRGANGFPKQVKSTTNPGGYGHAWVKARFIDIGEPRRIHTVDGSTRLFIPSLVSDNTFLASADPDYEKRLQKLPENERRALLLGEWNLAGGRFFPEFSRELHVVPAFAVPENWPRYFAMDYGLDMLAGYFVAEDPFGRAYVYKELYKSDLIISEAAKLIADAGENPCVYIAPPDLWSRRQDTGRSAAEIIESFGIFLEKAGADRQSGWLALKELLRRERDETGADAAGLRFFPCCINAIRALSDIQADERRPGDARTMPHELTHAPDALRYFASYRYRQTRGRSDSDAALMRLLSFGT